MYSVAPGQLFPVQLNDGFAALKWVILYILEPPMYRTR